MLSVHTAQGRTRAFTNAHSQLWAFFPLLQIFNVSLIDSSITLWLPSSHRAGKWKRTSVDLKLGCCSSQSHTTTKIRMAKSHRRKKENLFWHSFDYETMATLNVLFTRVPIFFPLLHCPSNLYSDMLPSSEGGQATNSSITACHTPPTPSARHRKPIGRFIIRQYTTLRGFIAWLYSTLNYKTNSSAAQRSAESYRWWKRKLFFKGVSCICWWKLFKTSKHVRCLSKKS